MKSHRILLLATILLLIYPTHAASRQEMQEPPAPIGGQGGSQKNEELLERLRKAAEQGAVFAQLRLGSMYHRGDEVPQDNSEAARWYRMAAEQGNADGQINLGLMYFQGTGITEDNLEAYFWLNLSVAGLKGQGKEEAEKLLNTVAEKMTPQQLAKSKRLGKEWRPKDRGQSGPNAFGAAAPLSTTGPTPAETATTRPMTTSAPAPAQAPNATNEGLSKDWGKWGIPLWPPEYKATPGISLTFYKPQNDVFQYGLITDGFPANKTYYLWQKKLDAEQPTRLALELSIKKIQDNAGFVVDRAGGNPLLLTALTIRRTLHLNAGVRPKPPAIARVQLANIVKQSGSSPILPRPTST